MTGNTVVDAMGYTISDGYRFADEALRAMDFADGRYLLLTAHRRENWGEGLREICEAAAALLEKYPDVHVIYPVHRNPLVMETAERVLGGMPRAHLIAPVSVLDLHNLMQRCTLILTDSGGIQEEAPALGKPVLVLREQTERPEVVEQGGALLVGAHKVRIVEAATVLLEDTGLYARMAQSRNPYGDGHAAGRILEAIAGWAAGNP